MGWLCLALFALFFVFVGWLIYPMTESPSTKKYKLDAEELKRTKNKDKEI
jgi:hypothetical protein